MDDHYVALLAVEGDRALVYDTRFRAEKRIPLPAATDPKFSASLILFSLPSTEETQRS